jgi:hypothetical protein
VLLFSALIVLLQALDPFAEVGFEPRMLLVYRVLLFSGKTEL